MGSRQNITEGTETHTKLNTCSKHGEYIAKVLKVIAGKEITSGCPTCQAEQKNKDSANKKQFDRLKFRDRLVREVGNNRVPKRFEDKSLDNYLPKNDEAAKIRMRCKGYVGKFGDLKPQGTSLVFSGKPGTGKTHLACAIANEIAGQLFTAAYKSVYSLVTEIKSTFRRDAATSEAAIIKSLLRPDLLILDEVGVQLGTDFEKVVIYQVVNSRYENMLPSVVVTNLSESDLCGYLGERTVDRLYENNGTVFNFDWESYRRGE